MHTTVHVLTFSLFFFFFSFPVAKVMINNFLLLIISLTELHVGSNSVSNRTAVLVVKQIGLPLHSCLILLNTCTFEIEVNSDLIFAEPRERRGKYSQSHYSPRLRRIIVLVYTHEVISTKSERKPFKSTIWLTDQITRKFKNRSLQNFQTWQFTSLSFRKQQRNGLNGTAKSLNCFLTWEEK